MKPQEQQPKRRGKRIELKTQQKYAVVSRWYRKDLENLNLALGLAVNPSSSSDWEKVADAVSKGCARKRTGEECRARAEKDGLLTKTQQQTASTSNLSDEDIIDEEIHQKPKRLTAAQKKKVEEKEVKPSNSIQDIHSKYYDDFFSKQESPLDAPLDLNDSLVRECFGPAPMYKKYTQRIRKPFIIPLVDYTDSGEGEGDIG